MILRDGFMPSRSSYVLDDSFEGHGNTVFCDLQIEWLAGVGWTPWFIFLFCPFLSMWLEGGKHYGVRAVDTTST
jgi:hypothetical protein